MAPKQWRKGSLSGNGGADCVEVAVVPGNDPEVAENKAGEPIVYLVRDSKNPEAAPLSFDKREWAAFIGSVKLGEFDPEAEPATV
ncbi:MULTISPECIES: DUF397 domain-containing protein [Streptosporangium]|uniref:DUF397 domain-containing protein n=1 Tax=Streptosporangium brasiliense TaxID=47480 RepID=A0ABT9RMR2_9ACTN|nr:DUF397 domain-containing protein [Streptosporangium brasiliense]MDP9870368.1 hypothetical protein [Streptosporangium brasiliense]